MIIFCTTGQTIQTIAIEISILAGETFHYLSLIVNQVLENVNFTMAPAPSAEEIQALADYFQQCGLAPARAAEACKNLKAAVAAHALFLANHIETAGLSDKQILVLLQVPKEGAALTDEGRNYIVQAIVAGRIKSLDQVSGK